MTTAPFDVRVVVSDPWEFVDSAGGNVLTGSVEHVWTSREIRSLPVVLRMAEPVRAKSAEGTAHFVAESSDPEAYPRLLNGESIECRLTGISAEQAASNEPFDVTTWRGKYPSARAWLRLP